VNPAITHDTFCDLAHLPEAFAIDPEGNSTAALATGRCLCNIIKLVRIDERGHSNHEIAEFITSDAVNEPDLVQDHLFTYAQLVRTGGYSRKVTW